MRVLSFVLLLSSVSAAQPSSTPAIDPDIRVALGTLSPVRVIVALKEDAPESTVLNAGVRSEDMRVNATFPLVRAVSVSVSPAGLAALAAHPAVGAVELDTGGFGVLAGIVAVPKLHKVAILDTGLPDIEELADAAKLGGELCFCRTASGAGCCPDGSAFQSGVGSARAPLPFRTTSLAWLQRPGAADPAVVTWDPVIVPVKVLSRQDRFESWEPVFAALEHVLANEPDLNVLLLSLASARIYSTDCGKPWAAPRALASGLGAFQARGGSVYVAQATGGPGPGRAAPACLTQFGSIPSHERLPVAGRNTAGLSAAGSAGTDAPRPDVAENGSAGYGIVESVERATADTPAVDTVGGATWSVVRVRVLESAPLAQGLESRLPAKQVVIMHTLDPVTLLLRNREVKFTASEVGPEGRSKWMATGWRLLPAR